MIEKATLLSGTVERSRPHSYHILAEDGVAYAVNQEDWHTLERDYQVGEKRFLIGQRVQFVPSASRNTRGLPYADNIVTPLSDMLKTQARSDAGRRALAMQANPNYRFPDESDS